MAGNRDRTTRPVPQFATETRIISEASLRPPEEPGPQAGSSPLPENTRVFLEITESPGKRGLFEMQKPIVILGRADGVADILVDDDAASRYHASVSYTDGRFVLADMGSTNGTRVNGEIVTEVTLKNGDEIRIGQTLIVFGVLATNATF